MIQLRGRCSAREVARALGRNEKSVMRELAALADEGVLVFEVVRLPRLYKLRHWTVRRERVRFYCLPVRFSHSGVWERKWQKN